MNNESPESVGIGEVKVGKSPLSFQAVALGSCVGVALYDSTFKVGGLAHIMLPTKGENIAQNDLGKFADTAIPLLVQKLSEIGGGRARLVAKIAGGAKMFDFKRMNERQADIGSRNVEAAKSVLTSLGIPIIAEEVGGTYGRTMILHLSSGDVEIISLSQKIRKII